MIGGKFGGAARHQHFSEFNTGVYLTSKNTCVTRADASDVTVEEGIEDPSSGFVNTFSHGNLYRPVDNDYRRRFQPM
jgi:hypothetical protein